MLFPANLTKLQLKKLLAVVLLSDGYLCKIGEKPRALRLTTSYDAIEQHKLFSELCQRCFNKEPTTRIEQPISSWTREPFLVSCLYSRPAAKDMLTLTQSYKTTPNNKETQDEFLAKIQPTLEFLQNEPKWFLWLAFRIFLDFDGSISPSFRIKHKKDIKNNKEYRYYQVQFECEVKIAETNPTLVQSLLSLALELDLRTHIRKDIRKWSGIEGISISECASVDKIIKRGPITNVRVHKSTRLRGVAKRTICNAVISFLHQIKGRRSWHFNNREDAAILKSFLNTQFNKILISPVV